MDAPASAWSDLSRPPLAAAALRAALLAPAGPLARLEVLAETGSTNTELVRRAVADPRAWPHASALVADVQTAGIGRLGRSWTSPPRAGLAVSVLLRPSAPRERWSWLPLLAGLAVTGAVRDVAGLAASVKWPNDVLVGERKLCGILAQVVDDAPDGGGGGRDHEGGWTGGGDGAGARRGGGGGARGGVGGVVVGIGLNATLTADELPVPTATSLALEGAATTDRGVVLRAVLRALAAEVARWDAAGGDPVASGLAARVREACSTLGRRVRVELPGGAVLAGSAEGLDDEGRLLVRGHDGALVPVAAGDVVHARPDAP